MALYSKQDEKTCGGCVHFRMHYIKDEDGNFYPLRFGHCTFPRIKDRAEGQTCPHWTPKQPEA